MIKNANIFALSKEGPLSSLYTKILRMPHFGVLGLFSAQRDHERRQVYLKVRFLTWHKLVPTKEIPFVFN